MFTKRFTYIVAIFGVLIIGLSAALLANGPRIRKADYDIQRLTEYSNQTIVLRANQPINNVEQSQISIEPHADFSVNTTGDNIIIQLKEQLRFETTYAISVSGISNSKNQQSNFKTTLTTLKPEYYYLQRGEQRTEAKDPDEIIDSKTSKSVYLSERIFDFDVIGSELVAVTGENRNNQLILVNPKSGQESDIALPTSGTIDNLETSPNNKLIGFTFRSNERGTNKTFDDALFIYDLEAKVLTQPKGINDKPITAGDWKFASDGTSIVVQTYDSGTIIADTTSANKPIPLGSYSTIKNFSGDGKKLSLAAPNGSVILDLTDGSKNPVTATEQNGVLPYVSSVQLSQNGTKLIRSLYLYKAESNYSHTLIDYGSGEEYTTLLDLDENNTSLIDYIVSSNDQLLAYEAHAVADKQEYDDYNTGSRPVGSYSAIIDTQTGKELERVQGINIVWKRN